MSDNCGFFQRPLSFRLTDLELGRLRLLDLWQAANFVVRNAWRCGVDRRIMADHKRAVDVVGLPGDDGAGVLVCETGLLNQTFAPATLGLIFGCTFGTAGPTAWLKWIFERNNNVPSNKSAKGRTTL